MAAGRGFFPWLRHSPLRAQMWIGAGWEVGAGGTCVSLCHFAIRVRFPHRAERERFRHLSRTLVNGHSPSGCPHDCPGVGSSNRRLAKGGGGPRELLAMRCGVPRRRQRRVGAGEGIQLLRCPMALARRPRGCSLVNITRNTHQLTRNGCFL